MKKEKLKGVLAPVLTPFQEDFSVSTENYVAHCKNLIAQGVGLAVFGTNSEGNSLTLNEKRKLLDTLSESGLPTEQMVPGTGLCSVQETVELTRHAVNLNCAGVLMLPPFYYKNVDDEGLYRYFCQVIDGVADERLNLYFYHIPPVSGVPISLALIERLLKKYPAQIAGIKDSSGSWENTAAMLKEFQPDGFDVFAGNETRLLDVLRNGGAGCITATGNVNPANIARLYEIWSQADEAETAQRQVNNIRAIFERFPVIPAMKSVLARHTQDDTWSIVRPPLMPLNSDQSSELHRQLGSAGFTV